MSEQWITNLVNEAYDDLQKIQQGEWTADDDARVAAQTKSLRAAAIREQAHLVDQMAHNEYINELSLATARQAAQGAHELASDAQFDYEAAVRDGDPADLDDALGRLEYAADFERSAAAEVDRLEEVCEHDGIDYSDFDF